ncbi:MFS alpha-glucoside transporter [Colletotrichum truncatum]|uniref:MFS alpha-glucoside transporter n=1 Tax=Colletotrichum truncatum TaxID=5467 RepID=A0ACC3ZD29_COLTU|nr:MFS alpha-glucoside transporter [Colletotrichum truncatum]KAF6798013.1 MFS alpha-glucoside transporter [Colletotrichum truncatum]
MASPPQPEKLVVQSTDHDEAGNEAARTTKEISIEAEAKGQGVTGYEELTPWQTVKQLKFVCLICFAVTFSAATDGYQVGMVGNIIANKGFVKKFGTQTTSDGDVVLASSVLSLWNILASVGQLTGMITLPFLSDRFGRKASMYYYWLLLTISVILECVAQNWQVWLVSKIFGGLGVGCLQSTIPTYISEVAPIRVRGAFLMCYSFWFTLGQFFAPVALQVLHSQKPEDYLTPIYTQFSQLGIMIIIYLLIPESPAWCASRDKEERAKKSLKRLYRGVPGYDVDHQYNLLVLTVKHERQLAVEQRQESWTAIFRGSDGKRTIVSLWTLMAQHFIGLGVFFSYSTYFFQQVGFEDPFKVTCITSSINIAFSIIIIALADGIGRRILACSGTTICWLCTVVVGILGVVPSSNATSYLLVLFVCIWNIGLVANGATGWGFIGEISSQRLRPYTAGFAAGSCSLAGILFGFLTPYMLNAHQWNWGLKASWLYAGLGLPFTAAMWFLIPETKNRSAAELDELFERKIKPWRFHKTTTATQRVVEQNKVNHSQ